jgi:quercetin dioxygenase-like cupin family protein
MKITPLATTPSAKGPADWFTGAVRLDQPFRSEAPASFGGAFVTFEPGARTNWHTHPKGQLLIVTAGLGWAQSDGGPVQEIRPGDVVWFDANERHWHGATDQSAMTHIAIAEADAGVSVVWAEPVTTDYRAP